MLSLEVLDDVLGETGSYGMYRELADGHRAGGKLNLLAAAHTRVGTHPVDLDSGHRGGNLHNVTG